MSVVFKKDTQVWDTGECFMNLNLLAHAQLIELDIGSECGGYGRCVGDKVILFENDRKKVNAPTEIELLKLTTEELNRGVRLACQCFPNRDQDQMVVTVP